MLPAVLLLLSVLAIVPMAPAPAEKMTAAQYEKWAIAQNDAAYDAAADRRQYSPPVGVRTETTMYGWSAGRRFGGFNNYRTRETTITLPGAASYGGGPVLLVNPFIVPK